MNFPVSFEHLEIATLPPLKKIEAIEFYLKSNFADKQSEFPLRHHRTHEKYVREIFLPKGTLLTSKVHNFDHISILSQGEVSIMTEFGVERRKAPCTWMEEAGIKRLIFVHSDTVWNTVHTVEDDMINPEELTNYVAHDSDLSWLKERLQ